MTGASGEAKTIRVGSWPGPSFSDNAIIPLLCGGLQAAGVQIVDVADPRGVKPGEIDVLQIHWPEEVFWRGLGAVATLRALVGTIVALRRLRKQGVRIAWLVHNLKPHDASPWRTRLWNAYSRRVAALTDAVITLSPATLPVVKSAFPFRGDVATLAIRHPAYPASAAQSSQQDAQRRWKMSGSGLQLVFVGSVRRYKGVLELARLVQDVEPGKLSLTIAGRTDADLLGELEQMCASGSNVTLVPGRLDDEGFESLMIASDFVVLPFKDSLHSGSIVHALSLGRPVLTLATPYAVELAEAVGPEWLQTYQPPLRADHLRTLVRPKGAGPNLEPLSLGRNAESLANLYRLMLSTPR